MNSLSIPRTRCAYCNEVLLPWHGTKLIRCCERCARPLALIPMVRRRGCFRLVSGFDLARMLLLPIVAAIVIDGFLGFLSGRHVAEGLALAIIGFGIVDAWDGDAALRTNIDRAGGKLRWGAAARRRGILKLAFGSAGVLFGASGLLALL